MAMDALERERLRRKMAERMFAYLEGADRVTCVSSHIYDEPRVCELCQLPHAVETVVVKNRSGKKLQLALQCLKEMIRFKVLADAEDLNRWIEKLGVLKLESQKRKAELALLREEERKKLERKVIVRKRGPERL